MRLMSLEARRAKKFSDEKRNKKAIQSKQLEYRILLELEEKLNQYLEYGDRVLLEVNPRIVGEFLNILTDKLLTMYDFEQVDKNKFIFYNKEISF